MQPITPVIIYTFVGDTAPSVAFTVTRQNIGAVDLTGCTVNFYIQNPFSSLRTNTGHTACTITNAALGKCTYGWGAADIPVEGLYDATLKITYANGTIESAPVTIEVASTV